MKAIVLFLFLSVNCFSQQLYRQTFSGGCISSSNGVAMVGETFNRSTSGVIELHESILFQIAHFTALSTEETNIQDMELNIFPNPIVEVLNFNHNESFPWDVTVYDNSGRIMLSKEKVQHSIDLSSLASGQYYVLFKNENQIIYKKIVKK